MSKKKKRIQDTDLDNLISHLRGEIGEIIFSWIFLREFSIEIESLKSGDFKADTDNPDLIRLYALRDKFTNEIVARLSELSERKIGQTTFHFAKEKLGALSKEVDNYQRFIISQGLRDRRNKIISHKELPPKWKDYRYTPSISYRTIVHGITMALVIMKAIDFIHLGPSSRYLWYEMRKRRYIPQYPARHAYMLLPYLRLSVKHRLEVVKEEMESGKKVWEIIPTTINGKKTKVLACKRWGIVRLGERLLVLDYYPLIELATLDLS